jgi:hypothetical protein
MTYFEAGFYGALGVWSAGVALAVMALLILGVVAVISDAVTR